MYGDTRAIRRLAHDLRDQGDDIRTQADRLVAEAEATPWRGQAAVAMRASAAAHAGELRRTARWHDEAAAAVLDHAAQVDRTKALIASIEAAVHGLVDGAKDRLSDLAGGVVDGVADGVGRAVGLGRDGAVGDPGDPGDLVLARFVAPAPGHLGWLQVDLPGLS